MKTTTVLLIVVGLYVVSQSGGLGSFLTPSGVTPNTKAPPQPQPTPVSGGGNTYNEVLALISSTANAVAAGLNYSASRTKTA